MRWSLPVTMTARVRRPLVASTSFVLPLALSMSRFTGSESSATIATIWSATTTLPCPTFTRCVTCRPPPFARLFKVLRLFTHLLDDALGGERRLAQLEVVRLRRDRVHLSIQLLDQEVQRPADRASPVQEQDQLLEVRAQPRQFFPHLGPEGGVLRVQLGAERLALRRTARHELVEGAAQYVREDRPRDPARRRLGVLRAHDARTRSEEHTSELQSPCNLVCRL